MGFITLLVYATLSFAVGIIMAGISLGFIQLNLVIPHFGKYMFSDQMIADKSLRWFILLVGVLIILFCIRYIQSIVLKSKRDKSITFQAPNGPVCITLFAIEDMLKKMLDTRPELAQIRPKVYSRKKAIEVFIRSNIASEVNILDVTNDLQEKVQEKLQQMLGTEKEIKIKVEIRKMFMDKRRKDSATTKAIGPEEVEAEEPEVPFRNYD